MGAENSSSFTITQSRGGRAFGIIAGVAAFVGVIYFIPRGGLDTVIGVVALAASVSVVVQAFVSRVSVDADTLTVMNGFRRRTLTRQEIKAFEVPTSFVRGGNAIKVIPASGRVVRLAATGRSLASFGEIGPLGDRLNSWLRGS